MRVFLSRAVIALAIACLGERHRSWALAMEAELEEAIDAGEPLAFAFGCLTASLRHMPFHSEGRFTLSAYALAICVMVPMAALQIGCAILSWPFLPAVGGIAVISGEQHPLLASAYRAATPSLVILMLLLGLGHLRLARLLLERDWSRVIAAGAFTLAVSATLLLLMGALFLDGTQVVHQGAILLLELGILAGLARWHAELPHSAGTTSIIE